MFSWHEYARLRSGLPFKDFLKIVRNELDSLGDTELEARDEIAVEARRYNGFGYDAKISATLEAGDDNDYDLKVRYEITPNALCILCLLFWPILLIVLLNGQSTRNRMRQDINDVLEGLEKKYGKRKPPDDD
jgi:hypothetical protein